jgi:hypothetical protein
VLPDFSFSFFPVQFCASLAEVFSVGDPPSVGRPDSRALCSDFPLAWIGSAARPALFVRGECLPLFFLLSGFSLVLDSGAKAARLGFSSCSGARSSTPVCSASQSYGFPACTVVSIQIRFLL